MFFVNTSFNLLKRQYISFSSIPGTYTLDVRRTPNQTDSDVTLPRSSYQGKITEKDWRTDCKRWIEYPSQISKLSYFNLLGLAAFWYIIGFPFRFFDVATLTVR